MLFLLPVRDAEIMRKPDIVPTGIIKRFHLGPFYVLADKLPFPVKIHGLSLTLLYALQHIDIAFLRRCRPPRDERQKQAANYRKNQKPVEHSTHIHSS